MKIPQLFLRFLGQKEAKQDNASKCHWKAQKWHKDHSVTDTFETRTMFNYIFVCNYLAVTDGTVKEESQSRTQMRAHGSVH